MCRMVALLNLFYPCATPLGGWVNWAALAVLLAHVGELPLFGILHLQGLR